MSVTHSLIHPSIHTTIMPTYVLWFVFLQQSFIIISYCVTEWAMKGQSKAYFTLGQNWENVWHICMWQIYERNLRKSIHRNYHECLMNTKSQNLYFWTPLHWTLLPEEQHTAVGFSGRKNDRGCDDQLAGCHWCQAEREHRNMRWHLKESKTTERRCFILATVS